MAPDTSAEGTPRGGPPWPNTGDEQLASVLALLGDGEIQFPNAPPAVARRLGPHLRMMRAIVYLREVGSSNEIGTRIQRLVDGATSALAPPRRETTSARWDKRHTGLEEHVGGELSEWGHAQSDAHTAGHLGADLLRGVIGSVEAVARKLEELREQAQGYEKELADAGFAFDETTGHVRGIPGPKGGRPRTVFPEIVEAVYDGLVEEGEDPEIESEMRKAIAHVLGGLFPSEWLATKRGGYLDRSLRNATRPNRGGKVR